MEIYIHTAGEALPSSSKQGCVTFEKNLISNSKYQFVEFISYRYVVDLIVWNDGIEHLLWSEIL